MTIRGFFFIDIHEMTSFIDNPNALVGIGGLALLLLIVTAAVIAGLKLKRKCESNYQGKGYMYMYMVISFYKILLSCKTRLSHFPR